VALLADTVHNVGDALTAVPLAIAFALLRRPPTKRLSYGWGRAEDFAGLAVVVIILFSAVYAAYESVARLIEPAAPSHLLATAIAGAVGFIGNEWVAVYRIRSGKRIGLAALVADGYHARVDGFTSLAVVLGVAGVAAGFELADPIVGIAISLVILRIVWQSLRTIGLRAMDGVEAGRSTRSRDPHAASTAGARSPTCGLAGTGMGSARSSRSTSRRTRASQRHTTSPNACATSCRTTYSTSQTSRSRHGRRTRPTAPRRRGAARPRCHRASTAWRPAARPTPDLQRSRLSSISSTPSD
jgi:hypothetical protein